MTPDWRADRAVARALASALLAGPWQRAELLERAGSVLGSEVDWLDALVDEVLARYPQPPVDRPRRLAEVVGCSEVLLGAAAAARADHRPLRVQRWRMSRVAMGAQPWPVPSLPDLARLAAWLELSPGQLGWLADPGGYQLRSGPCLLHLYSYSWLPRSAGPPRLLEAPTPILLRVQRQLLHQLLDRIPVHQAAHGFAPGRSVLSHARGHLGAAVVVTLDLSDFFARIQPGRLYGILRTAGYPEPVAHVLTGLCTTRTPGWVLRRMPPGGSDDSRYRLRAALRQPHLPQGAPTSPALANLACYHLDQRLTGYGAARSATYTRYADDLTFSGGAELSLHSSRLLRGVQRIVVDEGFRLNPTKTRVQPRTQRQLVTGVVVNERPNVTRQDHDRLRAVLHEARTRGPAAANRSGHPDFRRHLTGRVQWVESVNAARGRRLRVDLEAIEWPG